MPIGGLLHFRPVVPLDGLTATQLFRCQTVTTDCESGDVSMPSTEF